MNRRRFLLALAGAVIAGSARISAHSWYEPACCSDTDCAPLPAGASVEPVRGGYVVRMTPDGAPVFFGYDKVRPSRDGEIHACIGPQSGTPFCLYMPVGA